jgi:hypothetical protein
VPWRRQTGPPRFGESSRYCGGPVGVRAFEGGKTGGEQRQIRAEGPIQQGAQEGLVIGSRVGLVRRVLPSTFVVAPPVAPVVSPVVSPVVARRVALLVHPAMVLGHQV